MKGLDGFHPFLFLNCSRSDVWYSNLDIPSQRQKWFIIVLRLYPATKSRRFYLDLNIQKQEVGSPKCSEVS